MVPPVEVRSQTVKSEFVESENLKYKMESREEDMLELKKQLKLKVDARRTCKSATGKIMQIRTIR